MHFAKPTGVLFALAALFAGCLDSADGAVTGDTDIEGAESADSDTGSSTTGETTEATDLALEAQCDFTPPPGTTLRDNYSTGEHPFVGITSRGPGACVVTPRDEPVGPWASIEVCYASDVSDGATWRCPTDIVGRTVSIPPENSLWFRVFGGGDFDARARQGGTLRFETNDTDATSVEYPVEVYLPPVG